ncbi:MAG: hypothetical protein KJZ86_20515 [Caldilineaceae bacterium]|nr:hypothetical protein [Caldilineaceae bacterium]HRJ44948.1 hypothetical protein [Caldilineaceae bacterium]
MQSLTLSPELTSLLTVEANRTGKTLSTLAEDWLRQQYQTLRREQLAFQTRRFWENHPALYARYPDQYVAFYNDDVLDSDVDMRALALRVRAAHGNLPVVIAQVTAQPIVGYSM